MPHSDSTRARLRRPRQTKIVATLGPATDSPEMIERLLQEGVDVFRLNFSHGTQDDHARRIVAIREVEARYGWPIAIMADLQGPKLRLGRFAEGFLDIGPGEHLRLDLDPTPGDRSRIPLPHPEIFRALKPDDRLLLDDGKVRLHVLECGPDFALTEVEVGRRLSDRKGVNLPNTLLPLSPLTDKDRSDMAFALDHGADWIALSFVQRPEDAAEAKKLIAGRAALLVKMEKPQAIRHVDRLVEVTDAMMVARGDLGVEMPAEDVPTIQKRLIRACRVAGKPVIVATQMLESMITSPTPTRAEASDVATAVFDGADAVMLSAETASGQYPIEAVQMMSRIAARVESDPGYFRIMNADRAEPEETASDAITAAARQVAHTLKAAAIVTYTTSGSTTLRASRERPRVPIVCLTANEATARRLALAWGVHPVHTSDVSNFSEMVEKASAIVVEDGIGRPGQRLIVTAGVPFGTPGNTNVLRIAWIEG